MKALFVSALLFSANAFAHIEPGVHAGKQADGSSCEMTAGKQFFEKNAPHPLNERIPVTVNGVEFVVGHPSVIDAAHDKVGFNHDLFEGVVATPTGAEALIVDMIHTDEFEGPSAFTYIQNNWKTGEKSVVRCALR